MSGKPTPVNTEDLARNPVFEDALHDLVESGFGELHEELAAPKATPAPAPQAQMTSWW